MSDKKMKVSIVGLGFGAEFIPIYQAHANAEIHSICQRTESKLNEIGDQFNIERRHTCLLYTSPSPRDS